MINLYQGDCLEVLKSFPDNSVEAVVTDPPYGLAFMNKKWDYDVPSTAIWKEVLRVLKPGGHLLSFGGTRTYHRMVVNIEDAGFEIRDQIQWLYGSGFPKSLDISKAIDKSLGVKPLVGEKNPAFRAKQLEHDTDWKTAMRPEFKTKPNSESAKQWEGWGTALKPANEPIVLARKPLEKGLTVADNVLKWGVGGLNIDASRIGTDDKMSGSRNPSANTGQIYGVDKGGTYAQNAQGRFPANLLLDEQAAALLDEQSIANGIHSAGKGRPKQKHVGDFGIGEHGSRERMADHRFEDSTIGASRFFYVAKASKSERNRGEAENTHPTVKPVKLMEYLVKLITPPNGIVLDPFMGSGTTGVACKSLGIEFVGIEREEAYVAIAKKRTA